VGEDEMVEVPMVGGRAPKLCPRTTLSDILQPRAEELFGLIREDLERLGLEKDLRSGIVLTGGGADLEGIVEVAEGIFEGPVRRGVPTGVGGLTDVVSRPEWATATGLLLYGHRYKGSRRRGRGVNRITSSVSRMFRELF
jgi:cell division protein FtsA